MQPPPKNDWFSPLPPMTAPQTADSAVWPLRTTLVMSVMTMLPFIVLAISNALLAASPSSTHSVSPSTDASNAVVIFIYSTIVEAIFLIAPYLIYRSYGSQGLAALGLRGFNGALAIGTVILALAFALIATLLYGAIVTALHINIQTNADELQQTLKHMPLTLRATLAVAVFVAPICEEFFFRGFLLQGLRAVMSTPWAIVISALIFAVAHGDLGSFPLLLVLGLLLAGLRVVTKSIWPGVALHVANNAITAISLLVLMK